MEVITNLKNKSLNIKNLANKGKSPIVQPNWPKNGDVLQTQDGLFKFKDNKWIKIK